MQDYKVLSKGSYSPRTEEPVNITQWLFAEKDGKRYLLLKLSNDGSAVLSRVRVKINMLDKKGKYLGTVNAESSSIPEKGEFVFDGLIAVKDACTSFTAQIQIEDKSGYVYSQTENGVSVDYAADGEPNGINVEKLKKGMGGKSVAVSERGFKAPVLICIFACVLFVCAILFTCLQLISFKEGQYDFLRSGVEYTFVNGDKSDESELYVTGYRGNSPNVVIPERIERHLVVQISGGAFSGNRKIKRLTVEGDTQICLRAFYCCPNLNSVEANSVTQIDNEAFYGCANLQKLSINSAVTVGRRAFYECGITALEIPENTVTLSLGDYAFANCASLKEISVERKIGFSESASVFGGATSLVSLSIESLPENYALSSLLGAANASLEYLCIKNLSAISSNFCTGFTGLKSFAVESLEKLTIGDGAFNQCASLEDVSLPYGITAVDNSAFSGTAISSFDGNTLEIIGENAFAGCSRLSTFQTSGNTVLNTIGSAAFSGCESLERFIVPAGVSELPDNLFSDCSSLEKVVFLSRETLTNIGNGAFNGCSSLKQISIPESVRGIGYSAFRGCTSLTEINLPENITQIASYTFADCTSLEYLDIPENVTVFNPYAFRRCTSLKSLRINGNISSFGSGMLQGCTSLKELSVPLNVRLVNLFGGTVPDSLKKVEVTRVASLPAEAFLGCKNLRAVILNENLTQIGNNAFESCFRLYEIYNLGGAHISFSHAIEIYNSLSDEMPKAEDGGYTAAYSAGLDIWYLIDYPDNVTELLLPSRFMYNGAAIDNYTIADNLFYQTGATSAVIPYAVNKIGAYAFYNCAALEEITLSDGITAVGDYAFYGCNKLKDLSMPSGTFVSIGANAFANCVALERIEISATAVIGASAFENCYGLIRADISGGSGIMGERAFYGCSALESMVIPSGIAAVGQSAFSGCTGLTKVTLPATLRGINSEAFADCAKLRAVVNYSVLSITAGSVNFGGVAQNAVAVASNSADAAELEYIEHGGVTYLRYKTRWYAVWFNKSLSEIKIDSFTFGGKRADEIVICSNAFNEGYELSSVVIGSAVKEIGAYAFNSCLSLTNLQLPSSGLTKIGENAFSGCVSLTEINIPYGVTAVPDNAFSGCRSLSTVTLPDGVRTIGEYAFSGCVRLSNVNFPLSVTVIGGGAFSGCYLLTELTLPANLSVLGASAFANCGMLSSVRFPDKLTYISEAAFANCTSLSDVVLPVNLNDIGRNAFYGCLSLRQVHNLSGLDIRAGSESYGMVAYYAYKVFNDETQRLLFATYDLCKFVYVDGAWYLYAYEGSYYRTAELPEEFTVNGNLVSSYSIKDGALRNCRSIMIPASVKSIQSNAIDSYATIYYRGAQSQWLAMRPYSLATADVYFYTDKISGSGQWTYDGNGNIITSADR
ncbi:MAG: leucine-rich repeat domain-containing protein [Clostridia bacterium]|nr:leucine-rich repeat domain-containing protein [Clostridia bacterium]